MMIPLLFTHCQMSDSHPYSPVNFCTVCRKSVYKNLLCERCSDITAYDHLTGSEIFIDSHPPNTHKSPSIPRTEKINNQDAQIEVSDNVISFDTITLENESRYYLDDNFESVIKTAKGLSIIHFNARSLQHNSQQIEQYLLILNNPFDIVAISETWQTDNNTVDTFLPNFVSFHTNRTSRGGGVSIFVKNSLPATRIDNLSFTVDDLLECVTVEIASKTERNTVISCTYRKPGTDILKFTEHFERYIERLKNKKLYLCGDFNINLLKHETHQPTKQFIDSLCSLGLLPLINIPTRITDDSKTLIDNIFTNVLCTKHTSGALITDITDHFPIFTLCYKCKPDNNKKQVTYAYRRRIDENALDKLNVILRNEKWEEVINSTNVNDSYGDFIRILFEKLDNICPATKIRITKGRNDTLKPWFTKGLKNACKKKNALYRKYLRTKNMRMN